VFGVYRRALTCSFCRFDFCKITRHKLFTIFTHLTTRLTNPNFQFDLAELKKKFLRTRINLFHVPIFFFTYSDLILLFRSYWRIFRCSFLRRFPKCKNSDFLIFWLRNLKFYFIFLSAIQKCSSIFLLMVFPISIKGVLLNFKSLRLMAVLLSNHP